jgi:hypothetical protein
MYIVTLRHLYSSYMCCKYITKSRNGLLWVGHRENSFRQCMAPKSGCALNCLFYLPATHSATLTHRRARVTERSFNCNILNVRKYNVPRIVLHCSAFSMCNTKQNNRQAIVLHCSTFAKCSTERNNANPIVLLGMQLFYICQMQYQAEQ